MAVSAVSVLCAACQQSEPIAERELPSTSGPFAQFGYRNLKADHIPRTEMPRGPLEAYYNCAGGGERQAAAGWVRDWFAAVSRLDRCDQWAIDLLSSPRVRASLVYILERSQPSEQSCKAAGFSLFTSIEETHSLLTSFRIGFAQSCERRRIEEVAQKREAAFTQHLTALDDNMKKFRTR